MRNYLVRFFLGLAPMILVVCHVLGVISIPYLDRLEQIAYDTKVRFSNLEEKDPRVIIVDVDERSLSAEGHWPWRRDKIALLVEKLFDDYYADIVAFDILFAEPEQNHDIAQLGSIAAISGDENLNIIMQALEPYVPLLDRDRIFAETLSNRRAVLGYFMHTDPDHSELIGELPPPLLDDARVTAGIYAPKASGYSANLSILQQSAESAGFFSNPLVDSDGIYRRAPLLHEYDGKLYESLSLAITRLYLGMDVEPGFAEISGDSREYPSLEYLSLGPIKIPLDVNAAVLVPFSGKSPGFTYVSATDVLNNTVEDPDIMAGTIVLIGTSAPGLSDLRPTPVENLFPGVEIHANIITGIMDETIKWRPAYTLAAEIVTVVLLGLIGAILLPILSPIIATVATLILAGGDIGMSWYFWQQESHVLPLMSSLLLILSIYVLNMFYGFFIESRSKAQLRGLFGQYIPPELVEEMNKDPGRYSLDSQKRDLTVLFTDVRGFTTISESLDPDDLATFMNMFLTPMTRLVHKHRGTIDKYMGDAMMAFWGSPIEDEAHANHAVEAALDMIDALEEMQPQFASRGWPEVKIGIGLNSGPMNVGNMGSEFRMAYTVLGDAVNLGSRLEGLTKNYGVQIIVSEFTFRAAPDFLYRRLDAVRVKGKAEPVQIYEPIASLAKVSETDKENVKTLDKAIDLYREQLWDQSEELFRKLSADSDNNELYRIYLDRIDNYRKESPPSDWDGVFTFTSK
ncbi:MAG: adenylate cyclase [Parasphingorhabdus sp.]